MPNSSNKVFLLVDHPENSMQSALADTDIMTKLLIWETPLRDRKDGVARRNCGEADSEHKLPFGLSQYRGNDHSRLTVNQPLKVEVYLPVAS